MGRYTVLGSGGDRALPLPRRVARHPLTPGTYRLKGTIAGRPVFDLRFRLARRAHGRFAVVHSHLRDACPSTVAGASAFNSVLTPGAPWLLPTGAARSAAAGHGSVLPQSGRVRGAVGPSLREAGGSSGHPAQLLLFVLALGAVAMILFAAAARQAQSRG